MWQQWEPQRQRNNRDLRRNLWSHTFSGGLSGFRAVNPLVPVAECLETFRWWLGSKECCQESYVRFLNTHWQKEERPLHMCETRRTCATGTGQTGSYWKQSVKSGSVGASYQESRALLRKQREASCFFLILSRKLNSRGGEGRNRMKSLLGPRSGSRVVRCGQWSGSRHNPGC